MIVRSSTVLPAVSLVMAAVLVFVVAHGCFMFGRPRAGVAIEWKRPKQSPATPAMEARRVVYDAHQQPYFYMYA